MASAALLLPTARIFGRPANRKAKVPMERLDPRAIERVSGPSWNSLRPAFQDASRILLATSPTAASELTTIYVKFSRSSEMTDVFAVIWIKSSKQMVIGFALPDGLDAPILGPAPPGMKYKGLTKYLTVHAGEMIPAEFAEWATLACGNAQT
jgi:hypothetical protein